MRLLRASAVLLVASCVTGCGPSADAKSSDKAHKKDPRLATPVTDDPRELDVIADDGRPKSALAAMPHAIAGFAFGSSLDEATRACRDAKGDALTIDEKGVRGLACTSAPVKPEFPLDGVVVSLCDGRVCEVTLVPTGSIIKPTFGQRTEQLVAIHRTLEAKYGPAMHVRGSDEDLSRVVSLCAGGTKLKLRRSWFWRDRERETIRGRIVMGYDCEKSPSGVKDALSIAYEDEPGWLRRVKEYQRERESY